MSFNNTRGTRGVQPPAGPLHRLLNTFVTRNIAAHPDQVSVEIDGRTLTVTPEQLHGPERKKAWDQIAQSASRFAGYQDKTDRKIPVIRLTPRT